MKIALSGQMFDSYKLEDHLKAAVENGYEGVAIRSTHVPSDITVEQLERVKELIGKYKIEVTCILGFAGNYGLLSDTGCRDAFEIFKKYLWIAEELNSPLIRVWSAWQSSQEAEDEVWQRDSFWIKKSAELAKKSKKRIGLEMHHGTLCDTAEGAQRLLRLTSRDNVGLIFDPANMYQVPTNYGREVVKKLDKNIFDVHVKDVVQLQDDSYPFAYEYNDYVPHIEKFMKKVERNKEISEKRFYAHRLINQGSIDWLCIFKTLKEINYQGYLTVESFTTKGSDILEGYELAKHCYQEARKILEILKHKRYQEEL